VRLKIVRRCVHSRVAIDSRSVLRATMNGLPRQKNMPRAPKNRVWTSVTEIRAGAELLSSSEIICWGKIRYHKERPEWSASFGRRVVPDVWVMRIGWLGSNL